MGREGEGQRDKARSALVNGPEGGGTPGTPSPWRRPSQVVNLRIYAGGGISCRDTARAQRRKRHMNTQLIIKLSRFKCAVKQILLIL